MNLTKLTLHSTVVSMVSRGLLSGSSFIESVTLSILLYRRNRSFQDSLMYFKRQTRRIVFSLFIYLFFLIDERGLAYVC